MKRVISILMVFVLVIGVFTSALATSVSESGEFPLPKTGKFNYSAPKWMASAENRAYLTWLLLMDLVEYTNGKISVNTYDPMVDSAVGTVMGGIVVSIKTEDNYFLLISYYPSSDTAMYNIMGPGKATAQYSLEALGAEAYSNSINVLYTTLSSMME